MPADLAPAGEPYCLALLDWMACAVGGCDEPAARAAADEEGLLGRVAFLGTAGHVLDFDDTYLPGIAHLSAPTAPAALALAAAQGASLGDALAAYAAGFEAMAAMARASHPALYECGWHPTAVCGALGAATAAARLLGLGEERAGAAGRVALLRAGGLRAGFGSDGKALQVGLAAADGVQAARLAAAGASISTSVAAGPAGFAEAFGGSFAEPDLSRPAIDENWIKPWPCCLMAHSAIEAASLARAAGLDLDVPLTVSVHPRARAAAGYDDPADGLQAKFSIPYLVAHTLLHGEPDVGSFEQPDARARAYAREQVQLGLESKLGEAEAVVSQSGRELARIEHALGSPQRPMDAARLAAKGASLAGARLDGVLDDLERPATEVLEAAGLG